jgi:mono/diheme cytochrome c family protein
MSYLTRLFRRFLVRGALLAVAALAGAATVIAWAPAISPIPPPDRASFPSTSIARGATLAAIGDCAVCHTAANGRPYAGGRGVPTPFGIVFATNITPDPETGIGRWPLAAFTRAMRDGIDREGAHLYPVLPYPHFIRATDDDIAALYAFLMTRQSVSRQTPGDNLAFPFNWRPLLVAWDALFLRHDPWQPDAAQSAEWNRGAYLVDAVGHCGACHTPHNNLGAERGGQEFTGGEADGWNAPPLRTSTSAPKPWSADALAIYLRTGLDTEHGAAAGPMAPVTHQLASVPDADVRAIAVYIASLMPPATNAETSRPKPDRVGDPTAAAMFDGACGSCHAPDAPMTRRGAPSLSLSTAVNAPSARDVVNTILHGLPWREGEAGPYMPAFSAALTDAQVASVATYIRTRYTEQPPWPDIDRAVREARHQGGGS